MHLNSFLSFIPDHYYLAPIGKHENSTENLKWSSLAIETEKVSFEHSHSTISCTVGLEHNYELKF